MSVVFCVLSGVADKAGAFKRKSGKCEKEEEKLRQYKLDTAKELQVRQHSETNSWIMSKLN